MPFAAGSVVTVTQLFIEFDSFCTSYWRYIEGGAWVTFISWPFENAAPWIWTSWAVAAAPIVGTSNATATMPTAIHAALGRFRRSIGAHPFLGSQRRRS